jgi:hypothetical protein
MIFGLPTRCFSQHDWLDLHFRPSGLAVIGFFYNRNYLATEKIYGTGSILTDLGPHIIHRDRKRIQEDIQTARFSG